MPAWSSLPSPQFHPGDRVRRIHSNHIMVAGGEYVVSHQYDNANLFLENHDRPYSPRHFVKVEPKKKASGFKAFQQKLKKV